MLPTLLLAANSLAMSMGVWHLNDSQADAAIKFLSALGAFIGVFLSHRSDVSTGGAAPVGAHSVGYGDSDSNANMNDPATSALPSNPTFTAPPAP